MAASEGSYYSEYDEEEDEHEHVSLHTAANA